MNVESRDHERPDDAAGTDVDAQVEVADDAGDEIKPTDIVFDCPNCGHNLAIDYRGAGLQIKCVECGMPTLVPIPDGMNDSDLDLTEGELLSQLFQTRGVLNKREQQIAELSQALDSVKARRSELERSRMTTLHRYAELVNMCQNITRAQSEITVTLNRMLTLIAEEQQR
ncbi:MAG: hypothetical protein FWG50_08340 [Kiritimatiellaeota bacterium]|nr:hypothetical protein [Kiritimatiellota bacterium]